jgi:hypothetical protein
LFGAAALGKKRDATPVERGWVLLAGPLPGLIVGSALIPFALTNENSWLQQSCWMLLAINLFNLVPGGPLDGGRFLSLVLFSRKPMLRAVAQILGAALLGYLAWLLDAYLIGVIAFFTLTSTRYVTKSLECALRLREELGEEVVAQSRPSDDDLPQVARIVVEEFQPLLPRIADQPKRLAVWIFNTWNEAQLRPPTWKASAGLLAVYVFAWLVAPATLLATLWVLR